MLDKFTKKAWTPTTLKWFSVFSIGAVAHLWAVIGVESSVGLIIVLGISAVIVVSILFVENSRVTSKPNNEHSGTRRYFKAFVFVGFAIIAALAGWFGGTAVRKFIEIVMSSPMSP